jgi:hypothetical protein
MWICRAKASDMSGWRGQIYDGQYPTREHFERGSMSGVLWCDKGEHAFSRKDKFKRHFEDTHEVEVYTGNSYGNPTYQPRQEVHEEIDICGVCWAADNPFTSPEPTAIEAVEAEAAESEADMWRAKYEAEAAKNTRKTAR